MTMTDDQIKSWIKENVRTAKNHFSTKSDLKKAFQLKARNKSRESNARFFSILDELVAPVANGKRVYDATGKSQNLKGLYEVEYKPRATKEFTWHYSQSERQQKTVRVEGYVCNLHLRANGSVQLVLVNEDGEKVANVYTYGPQTISDLKSIGSGLFGLYVEATCYQNSKGGLNIAKMRLDGNANTEPSKRIIQHYAEAYDWSGDWPSIQRDLDARRKAERGAYSGDDALAVPGALGLNSEDDYADELPAKERATANDNELMLNTYLNDFTKETPDNYTSLHTLAVNFSYRFPRHSMTEEAFNSHLRKDFNEDFLSHNAAIKQGLKSIDGAKPQPKESLIPVSYRATFGGYNFDYSNPRDLPEGLIYGLSYRKGSMHAKLITASGELLEDQALDYAKVSSSILVNWLGEYAKIFGGRLSFDSRKTEKGTLNKVSAMIKRCYELNDYNLEAVDTLELATKLTNYFNLVSA